MQRDPLAPNVEPAPSVEAVLAHRDFVGGLARGLLADVHLADDVAQETLRAGLERAPRGLREPRAWLAAVARNLAYRTRRDAARRSQREEAAARGEGVPSVAEVFEREALRRRVVEAVLALPEAYRDVLLLRFYEDLPPREIARRLATPVETVRTRQKRGLALLRQQLREEYGRDERWALALLPLAGSRAARPLAALLLIPAALLLAVAAAFVLSRPSRPEPRVLPGALASAPADEARAAVPAGQQPAGDPLPGARAVPDADPGLTPRAVRRVAGRVIRPAGSAPDETLRVAAYAREPRRALSGDASTPLDTVSPEEELAARPAPLASARVDVDGAFELALPAGARRVWLAVDGRQLHLRHPIALSLPAGDEPLALAPVLGGYVSGTLVASVGPVAGAIVLASIDAGAPIANADVLGGAAQRFAARVDQDGHFELRGLPAGCTWVLAARLPGRWVELARNLALPAGGHRSVELVAGPNAPLRGRVVDAEGVPVGAARVWVWRERADPMADQTARLLAAEATSDGAGRFALTGPVSGRLAARAARDLCYSKVARVDLDLDPRAELELVLPRSGVLPARVLAPDGRPAAGARVIAFHAGGSRPGRFAGGPLTADEEGRLAFHCLEGEEFRLVGQLSRDGRVVAGGELRASTESGAEPELRLAPCASLVVRALDEAGQPVPRPVVIATWRGDGPPAVPDEVQREESYAAGRARLEGLAPGRWRLGVEAPGRAGAPLEVELVAGENPVLDVTLQAAAEEGRRGRVLAPDGRPVAGAEIYALAAGSQEVFLRGFQSRLHVTDAHGRFPLPSGDRLLAFAPGFAPGELTLPSEEHEPLVRLRHGGVVRGSAYDGAGRPAAGWMVRAMQDGRLDLVELGQVGEGGGFELRDLAPGSWWVSVEARPVPVKGAARVERQRPVVKSAEVRAGEVVELVFGTPAPAPVRVRGRVSSAGRPWPGELVFLRPGSGGMGELVAASADEDGRYQLTLPGPGAWVLAVTIGAERSEGIHSELHAVPPCDDLELDVELPAGVVAGRLTDDEGVPLEGVTVILRREGALTSASLGLRPVARAQSDGEGRFRFELVAPGAYALEAGDAQHARRVVPGLLLEGGETVERDLVLGAGGRVAGRVLDAEGRPVRGAGIFAYDAAGRLVSAAPLAESDARGAFETELLAPGEYALFARTRELASPACPPLDVPPGAAAEVELVALPATRLSVAVREGRELVERFALELHDEAGRALSGLGQLRQPRGGRGVEGPHPPGTYRLRVRLADGREKERRVRLDGQPTEEVRVGFRR